MRKRTVRMTRERKSRRTYLFELLLFFLAGLSVCLQLLFGFVGVDNAQGRQHGSTIPGGADMRSDVRMF